MSGPGRGINELPLGRRIAQWRVRRNMTQQQFADQIGKSKSWVDKVERGVRRLERVSNLRAVAATLRIDLGALLAERPGRPDASAAGLEGVRAALARYHVEAPARPPDVAEQRGRLDHAEQAYRHARYPELLDLLPGLLDAARAARATHPGRAADELLVAALRPRRLGAAQGRSGGVGLAGGGSGGGGRRWPRGIPRLAAAATVPLAQTLRYGGRPRSAMETAVVAAYRLMPSAR